MSLLDKNTAIAVPLLLFQSQDPMAKQLASWIQVANGNISNTLKYLRIPSESIEALNPVILNNGRQLAEHYLTYTYYNPDLRKDIAYQIGKKGNNLRLNIL